MREASVGDTTRAGEMPSAADAVNALSDRFWDGVLDLSPIGATLLGYEQGMDRLDDPGPDGREKARSLYRETLAEAAAIRHRQLLRQACQPKSASLSTSCA